MSVSGDGDQVRWQTQTSRIKESLNRLLGPDQHGVTLVHSDNAITFRVEALDGRILTEDLRGTKVSEIESMSDEFLENRLKEMLQRTT